MAGTGPLKPWHSWVLERDRQLRTVLIPALHFLPCVSALFPFSFYNSLFVCVFVPFSCRLWRS